MGIRRIGRHLLEHHWRVRRIFAPPVLVRIEAAIRAGEATHSGQLRFVVEGALDGLPLFRDQRPRERALDVFSHLRIWDTAHNNGVLIYLLLADRDVEIVADRGIDAKVPDGAWDGIVGDFTRAVGEGRVADGFVMAIERCGGLLASHFPRRPEDRDELANRLFEI